MQKAVLLLFYCLLFTVHSSYAQKIRFTDTTNVWKEETYDFNFSSYTYEYRWCKGQVTYNGKVYSLIDNVYVRDDTASKKVYAVLVNINPDDTTEHILLDYTLKLGDTFQCLRKGIPTGFDTILHVVKKIDSTYINGILYRVWTYKNVYMSYQVAQQYHSPDYVVIEGVGCMKGVIFPLIPLEFEQYQYLRCFSNNGNEITVPSYLSSATCALSVQNLKQPQSITIIPNPANESSKIVFPYAIQLGRFVVTNAMGQVVLQKEFQNKSTHIQQTGIAKVKYTFCRTRYHVLQSTVIPVLFIEHLIRAVL
jgi:hypothetical protein